MEPSSSEIKKLLIFQEMELSCSNIKKCIVFSQKKVFYISGNGNPEIILYILGKELSYISGKGNPKKHYYN